MVKENKIKAFQVEVRIGIKWLQMDSELVMTTFLRGDNEHKYKARQISNSINPMYN